MKELPLVKDRVVGMEYIFKGKVLKWSGTRLLCKHGKENKRCKDCGGTGLCVHDRVKSSCKPCGGVSFCEHEVLKSICKICKGASVCTHGRIKTRCKECHGSGICIHEKRKEYCKICDGSGLCIHEKRRTVCKECSGGGLCMDGKPNTYCKECGGGGLCVHDKRKHECRECGGKSFCEHNIQRKTCKICKGSEICIHETMRYSCKLCSFDKHPECWCCSCEDVFIKQKRYKKYKSYCFKCYCVEHPDEIIPRRFMLKENYIHEYLKLKIKKIQLHNKGTGGCSLRRPDWFIDMGTHIIIIECDEEQHRNYSCTNRRTMELFQDFGERPIVLIRFNPDKYKSENKKHKSCFDIDEKNKLTLNKKQWTKRSEALVEMINKYIELDTFPEKEVTVEHMFYDC